MAPSYRIINYSLKPAKSIERKMIAETLKQLERFERIENYRYIGFGSIYFTDFSLFHKNLGISDMISIEDEDNIALQKRFEFNRPYSCIHVKFGHSNSILPQLDWGKKTILWLDYDNKLERGMLADISHFCTEAQPGSVIIISVNAHLAQEGKRLEALENSLGMKEKIPNGVTEKDFAGWGTARVYRQILVNEIQESLIKRGAVDKMSFRQMFNFHYDDRAKMLTIGGIIYTPDQKEFIDNCGLERLSHFRQEAEPYQIKVPQLTLKELRHVDAQLPSTQIDDMDSNGIEKSDLIEYSKVYRHFPNFAEIEM